MSEEATLDRFLGQKEEREKSDRELDPKILTGDFEQWEKVTLNDVADNRENSFVDGPFGANLLSEEFHQDGFARIIKLQNIRRGKFIDTNQKYITNEKFDEIERHAAYPNEVAIAKMAEPVARACILPEYEDQYILAAADVVKLDSGRDFSNLFVMYVLNSYPVWQQAFSRSRGTGRKRINLNQLKEVQIPAPPLSEQRKISTVLYTVDRAIEKSEEVIEQADRMKKGIIQETILDRISKAQSPTTLGGVPDDWEKVKLEDVASYKEDSFVDGPFGSSLKAEEFVDDGFARILQLQNVNEGWYSDSNVRYVDKQTYEELERHSAKPGDIFIAKMASPVARACILPDDYDHYMLGCADVVKLTPNQDFVDEFVVYCLNSYPVWKQAAAHIRGSGRLRVNLNQLKQVEIPKPPRDEQQKIVTAVSGISDYIESNKDEKKKLERIKRGLMQDLLSGTVRTTDTNIEVPDEIAQYG